MGNIIKGVLAILVLLVAVILFRTFTFGGDITDYSQAELPTPPAIDVNQAAENLGTAIRIKTITTRRGDPQEGREGPWIEFRAFLESTYPDLIAKVSTDVVSRFTLIYTWEGTDPSLDPIILMAHQDVVPINMGTVEDWEHGPFAGLVADGYVWGRGAMDDKGSLISIMEAGNALAKSGWTPKRTVIFQFGHDEEIAGTGAEDAFAFHKANGVTPFLVLDEGMAVIKENPLTGKQTAFIGVAEKGYQSLLITTKTQGGHSSRPPRESGAVRIARAIVALEENQMPADLQAPPFADTVEAVANDLPFTTKMAFANKWAFGGLIKGQADADATTNALLRTTTAPTMLAGSIKDNVLPQQAQAVVNFRIHPADTIDDLMAHVKKTTSHIEGLDIQFYEGGIGSAPSPVSASEGEVYDALASVASAAGDGALVAPALVIGGTDARYATAIASTQIYRFTPAIYSDEDLSGFHGTNERVSVDNVGRMSRSYAQLMMMLAGEN